MNDYDESTIAAARGFVPCRTLPIGTPTKRNLGWILPFTIGAWAVAALGFACGWTVAQLLQ